MHNNSKFPGYKLVGSAAVDSGQLLIIDPCYLKDWKAGDYPATEQGGNNYDECCNATLSQAGCGQVLNDLAFVTGTGWGDGVYNIYGKMIGGRVVSVIIDMEYDEDEEEECYEKEADKEDESEE